jgi:hypothetical protein
MRSIETRRDEAESHFRAAEQIYAEALVMFNEGPDRILPHRDPNFASARVQIEDAMLQADENLNYARDFGMQDVESITRLREKVADLKKRLLESKKA